YRFDLARGLNPDATVERMRGEHNRVDSASKRWSYGPDYQKGLCATSSYKTPGCNGGSWAGCGSNTFPDGDFPACRSPLDVYDLNGNAAEHMNLPLNESQMSRHGSRELGYDRDERKRSLSSTPIGLMKTGAARERPSGMASGLWMSIVMRTITLVSGV